MSDKRAFSIPMLGANKNAKFATNPGFTPGTVQIDTNHQDWLFVKFNSAQAANASVSVDPLTFNAGTASASIPTVANGGLQGPDQLIPTNAASAAGDTTIVLAYAPAAGTPTTGFIRLADQGMMSGEVIAYTGLSSATLTVAALTPLQAAHFAAAAQVTIPGVITATLPASALYTNGPVAAAANDYGWVYKTTDPL